jgi:hypothetical protein
MLNEVSTSLSSYLASQGQISRKKGLMTLFNTCPELGAFINKMVNDITSFYHFEPVGTNSQSNGKNKILRVHRFILDNQYRQLRGEIAADSFITGDGFCWLGMMKPEQIASKIKEVMDNYSTLEMKGKVPQLTQQMKNKMYSDLLIEMKVNSSAADHDIEDTSKFTDEDVLALKKIRYMPSSTVEVVYDRYDVKGYNHFLGVYMPIFFAPEEVIHFKMMRRNGKVNGYTPVQSLIVQIELLRQMWQNQLSLHKNGGAPDKIFNLKNLNISSPAYKRMEEQIAKYRLAENKHGNMLFTGDLNVIDMQQIDTMQFKDSGLYVTGVMAMQWGFPKSSIPYIVGGTNTKDDTGGNAERGYWETIKGFQLTEAETWNTQLFIPYFGVKLVPELSFPQAEIQEQAVVQAKVQNLQNINSILQQDKMKISVDKKLEMLGISEDDIEEMTPEEISMQEQMQLGTLNTGSVKTSKDKPQTQANQQNSDNKRQEQQNTIASRGKPTGYGKEFEDLRNEIVELKGFIAGTIQRSIIPTMYANQPRLRNDAPIKQFADNNQNQVGKADSALVTDNYGPSFPADWNIDKDNKIRSGGVQKNYKDRPMFHGAEMTPQVPPQKSFAPGSMINNSNMDNPAGNVNYSGNFQRDEGGYIANDDLEHDTPQTKPVKNKVKSYPTQRKYPDEPTQFPGKDEKESNLQQGTQVEMEHEDMFKYLEKYLEQHGRLPKFETIAKQIAKDHISEVQDYYDKLKKIEETTKEFW